MTPRPTRRQKEHGRDRSNANQLKRRVFLTPRPTRRQKELRRDRNKANQEETETKQINLR